MIPYEVLVDALSAWKAQTAPRPQSSGTFDAEDTLAEDLGEVPPAYDDATEGTEAGPEDVEMMDSEMVVLDEESFEGSQAEAEEPSYTMDEVVEADGHEEALAEGPEHDPDHG